MSRRTEIAYKAKSPGKLAPRNEALHFIFPGTRTESPRAKHSLAAFCIFIYLQMDVPHSHGELTRTRLRFHKSQA